MEQIIKANLSAAPVRSKSTEQRSFDFNNWMINIIKNKYYAQIQLMENAQLKIE